MRQIKFSAVLTAIIWTIWHLPLLYLPGTELYHLNFGLYFMNLVGLSFALGAMFKISNNIFLCSLFHGLVSAVFTVFLIQQTFWGTVTGTVLLISFSLYQVKKHDLKMKEKNEMPVHTIKKSTPVTGCSCAIFFLFLISKALPRIF